jgi:hypothetical protein
MRTVQNKGVQISGDDENVHVLLVVPIQDKVLMNGETGHSEVRGGDDDCIVGVFVFEKLLDRDGSLRPMDTGDNRVSFSFQKDSVFDSNGHDINYHRRYIILNEIEDFDCHARFRKEKAEETGETQSDLITIDIGVQVDVDGGLFDIRVSSGVKCY